MKRVILVTGANGTLGLAIARAFLENHPQDVVWLGTHSRDDDARALASTQPDRCHALTLDVTCPESWLAAVRHIVAASGPVDVLVNNAGTHEDALLATMPPSAWERVRATNLDGVFHGCQAVLPDMVARRQGRIINVASLSALLPPAGQANYAAAKAGVLALTRSLAKEVARLQITINAICPGYIETNALAAMDPDARKAAIARIPMRRFGQPHEVAAAVTFLASPAASYITGAVLKIDGGIL